MDGCIVKTVEIDQMIMFAMNSDLSGFLPRPFFAINNPPTMNAVLRNPHINPQTCTDTSDNPYASIRDMKTPPRKLLNVVNMINEARPGTDEIIFKVPRISSRDFPFSITFVTVS